MFNSILIAVDGSEHAKKALEVACRLMGQDNATLHILHVPEVLAYDTTMVWGIGAVALESSREVLEDAGQKIIEKASDAAREQGASHVETHLHQGDPARLILRKAEDLGVEAIVLGSRGLGNFAGLMMGSVSHKVTHSAKCSVITVR